MEYVHKIMGRFNAKFRRKNCTNMLLDFSNISKTFHNKHSNLKKNSKLS